MRNAINRLVKRMENAINWLSMSGLKINTAKTEICIFHRRNVLIEEISLMGTTIRTGITMNVLGIKFDSKLKWNAQVEQAIKGANTCLYGIKMISKHYLLKTNKIVLKNIVWFKNKATQTQSKTIKDISKQLKQN